MQYKLTKYFKAPIAPSARLSNKQTFKEYEEGEIIEAVPFKQNNTSAVKFSEAVLVDDAYIIPISYLKALKQQSSSAAEGNAPLTETPLPKEDSKKIVLKTPNKMAQGYGYGAVAGVGLGIVIALILKKPMIWYGIGGLVIGGYLGKKISEAGQVKPLELKAV